MLEMFRSANLRTTPSVSFSFKPPANWPKAVARRIFSVSHEPMNRFENWYNFYYTNHNTTLHCHTTNMYACKTICTLRLLSTSQSYVKSLKTSHPLSTSQVLFPRVAASGLSNLTLPSSTGSPSGGGRELRVLGLH